MSTKGGDNANVPFEGKDNVENKVDNAKLQAETNEAPSSNEQAYKSAVEAFGPMKETEEGKESGWLSYAGEKGKELLAQFAESVKTMTPKDTAALIKENDSKTALTQGAVAHIESRLQKVLADQKLNDQRYV
ncbi:MAG: hypothetical protein K2W82_16385 [Candidatus Obscuribacterales bacterium]|nr:hypothetical protein [Candidatus Obscuribacterales bacterium]